jgi:hypothetical protein
MQDGAKLNGQHDTLKQATADSFHIIPNLSFTNYPIIDLYLIVSATNSVIK